LILPLAPFPTVLVFEVPQWSALTQLSLLTQNTY
jgi:hypothetical protein